MNGDVTKIYTLCSSCGEMIKSDSKTGYCGQCNTPEKRARLVEQQKVVRAENIAKGYIYSA